VGKLSLIQLHLGVPVKKNTFSEVVCQRAIIDRCRLSRAEIS